MPCSAPGMILGVTCFSPLLHVRTLFAPSNGSFSDDISSIGVVTDAQFARMRSIASGECIGAPAAQNVTTARSAAVNLGAASNTPVPPTLEPTRISRVGSMKLWNIPHAAMRTMSSAMFEKPIALALATKAAPNASMLGSAGVGATFAPVGVQIDFPWPRMSNAIVAMPRA